MKKSRLKKKLDAANKLIESQFNELKILATQPDSVEAMMIRHRINFIIDISSAGFMGGYTNEIPTDNNFSGFCIQVEEAKFPATARMGRQFTLDEELH